MLNKELIVFVTSKLQHSFNKEKCLPEEINRMESEKLSKTSEINR